MNIFFRIAVWPMLVASVAVLSACSGNDSTEEQSEPLPTSIETRTTGRSMDVGIRGDGLFVLQLPDAAHYSYTRLGHLDLDPDGRLVHADGGWVMGIPSDPAAADAQPLPLMPLHMEPKASSQTVIQGNLGADVPLISAETPFNPADAVTYNYALSFSCWASDGTPLYVTMYFVHTNLNEWQVHARVKEHWVESPFTLQFGWDSSLSSPSASTMTLPVEGTALSQPLAVRFDFTQYGARFQAATTTDGYAAGQLRTVNVGPEGKVQLEYDNAQTIEGGQLLLARFTVADRLIRTGGSSWKCGDECRRPLFGVPGSSMMGTTQSGTLNTAY